MSQSFLSDEKLLVIDTEDKKLEESLNIWCGSEVPFKNIQCVLIIHNDVRVLIDERSFTAFFPPELWKKFDIQVNPYLRTPDNKTQEDCWIAKKDYRYSKINIDKMKLGIEGKDYYSDDLSIRSKKITDFFNTQFIDNNRAYADSSRYSIGYQLEYPNIGQYNRLMRLLGNFEIKV